MAVLLFGTGTVVVSYNNYSLFLCIHISYDYFVVVSFCQAQMRVRCLFKLHCYGICLFDLSVLGLCQSVALEYEHFVVRLWPMPQKNFYFQFAFIVFFPLNVFLFFLHLLLLGSLLGLCVYCVSYQETEWSCVCCAYFCSNTIYFVFFFFGFVCVKWQLLDFLSTSKLLFSSASYITFIFSKLPFATHIHYGEYRI